MRQFFLRVYNSPDPGRGFWVGDVAECVEGETADWFRDAVLERINYFRAMAGVPADVQLLGELNRKAQIAAAMFSINLKLSHNPANDWICYSALGAEAARFSNIALGVAGIDAVDRYMADPGESNRNVGHRRWILYPPTTVMGTGDVPDNERGWAANALWILKRDRLRANPVVRDRFVAWPPPGYAPYPLVYPRWSFSFPNADFSAAHIEMTQRGQTIQRIARLPAIDGAGWNTIVWEPTLEFQIPPETDQPIRIKVRNVKIGGTTRDFEYVVIIMDPDTVILSVESDNAAITWADVKRSSW